MVTKKYQNLLHKELSYKIQGLIFGRKNLLRKFLLFVAISISFVAIRGLSARAAEILIQTKNTEIKTGDQFETDIFINTENQQINALEGKIIFPNDLLELAEINEAKSIIIFWIEKPRLESNNQILFSGIVPGGYNDKKGELLSLIFKTKKQGSGEINFNNVNVLANDGKGTPLDVKISNFKFSISDQAPHSGLVSEPKDVAPPENFELTIASSTDVFGSKWFVVFATQDKGTGIDHYEIQETTAKAQDAKWETTESPYLLKDQNLRSYIYVKAVDKSGNERIAMLQPRYPIKWYEKYENWIIIIIIILLIYFIGKILWKKIIPRIIH